MGFVKDGCRFVVELLVEDEDVALGLVGRAREEVVGLCNVILGKEEVVDHNSDLGWEVQEGERLVGLDVGFYHRELSPTLDGSEPLVILLDRRRS